jgi:Papain-like cysteine protease AvrRpt2
MWLLRGYSRKTRHVIMSRKPGPENYNPLSLSLPPRTPGSLGHNDAGDPLQKALLGDTPGPLGLRDGAAKLASWFTFGEAAPTHPGWVRADLRGLKPIAQAASTLCWLTCYEMLYVWKGVDPKTIEGKLRGRGLDFDAARRRGLLDNEFELAARALGLAAFATGSGISGPDIKQMLTSSPLWLAGEWFPNGKHVRVVIGASDDWVEYFDPWYGGTYGTDLQHKDLLENFLHGDRRAARGTDALMGKFQMQYWRA